MIGPGNYLISVRGPFCNVQTLFLSSRRLAELGGLDQDGEE